MGTTFVSPPTLGDLVKREFDPSYCRETVTLKAGDAYPLGSVLGRITTSGNYALSPDAQTVELEGAEIACAVLLVAVPASEEDTQALVLARGPVIVADQALIFDASITDATARNMKHQQLAAHGIVVRPAA